MMIHIFLVRYTKWGEAYAAKEEKKKSKAKGRELPDPNKVNLPFFLSTVLSHSILRKIHP